MTEVRDLLRELMGTDCRCGGKKNERRTFCGRCDHALPPHLRHALYRPIGAGYEEAYREATEHLKESA